MPGPLLSLLNPDNLRLDCEKSRLATAALATRKSAEPPKYPLR